MVDLKEKVVDYVEPVFRFCLKRLAERRDAEDLSQEILVHVLNGIGRYDIKNIDAWVWQIARNRYARFVDFKGKE
jgi:DNA-directed RNA polymerase specialized sigma24 family protein